MLRIAACLGVLLVQFLVGTNAGDLVAPEKCSDDAHGCIVYPPAKNQTYHPIDSIVVVYNSPWEGGVNLSLNCWPSIDKEGGSNKPVQLSGHDLFCGKGNCKTPVPIFYHP